MVYEADGTYLTTVKRGEGPGEFRYPWMITPVGDSLFVQDRGRGFLVVGPDLKIARSIPGPPNMGRVVVLDWPDSVLINTRRYDARTDMNPYHVVSFSGQEPVYIRSFGAERAAPTDPREFVSLSRVIGPAQGEGIWVVQPRSYRLRHLSMSGEVRRALVRAPSWFSKEVPPINFKEPPPPHIAAVHEDSTGLLWVYIRVAAPTWREGYPKLGEGVGEVSTSAFAMDMLYDGIIEVIDPRTARVLARTRVDGNLIGPISGGRVAIYDTTADGEPFVQVMRLSLRR